MVVQIVFNGLVCKLQLLAGVSLVALIRSEIVQAHGKVGNSLRVLVSELLLVLEGLGFTFLEMLDEVGRIFVGLFKRSYQRFEFVFEGVDFQIQILYFIK